MACTLFRVYVHPKHTPVCDSPESRLLQRGQRKPIICSHMWGGPPWHWLGAPPDPSACLVGNCAENLLRGPLPQRLCQLIEIERGGPPLLWVCCAEDGAGWLLRGVLLLRCLYTPKMPLAAAIDFAGFQRNDARTAADGKLNREGPRGCRETADSVAESSWCGSPVFAFLMQPEVTVVSMQRQRVRVVVCFPDSVGEF